MSPVLSGARVRSPRATNERASAPIDVGSGKRRVRVIAEATDPAEPIEEMSVEVSTDNGASWSELAFATGCVPGAPPWNPTATDIRPKLTVTVNVQGVAKFRGVVRHSRAISARVEAR